MKISFVIAACFVAFCSGIEGKKMIHPMKKVQQYTKQLQTKHEKSNELQCLTLVFDLFGVMMNATNACGRANITSLFDDDNSDRCQSDDDENPFETFDMLCSGDGKICLDTILNKFVELDDHECLDMASSGDPDCGSDEVNYEGNCLPACPNGNECCSDETCNNAGACFPNNGNVDSTDGGITMIKNIFDFACVTDGNGNNCAAMASTMTLDTPSCAELYSMGCCYGTVVEMFQCLSQDDSVEHITDSCPDVDGLCDGTPPCAAGAPAAPLAFPLVAVFVATLFFA